MKRICEWAMALLFSGVLLILMAATILLPKNRYSYYENRNLSAFPEITAESVLSGQVFDASRPYSATTPPGELPRSRPSHGPI